VLDIGTGSGAIALAVASEAPVGRLVATDLSADALRVARDNARHLEGQLAATPEFRLGFGYAPVVGESFDLIVSNPPYIAYAELERLPPSVRDWEPPTSLVCGGDGLEVTRQLIAGAPEHLRSGGRLALEVDERRAGRVAAMVAAQSSMRDIRVHRDLADRERFVTATRA
jgi:release factor glutamine methyltransferase